MNPSLQRRLSRALLFSIAGVALVAGVFSFMAAYDEARELQDDVLHRMAQLVERVQERTPGAALNLHVQGEEDDTRVTIQTLDGAGAWEAQPGRGLPLALPTALGDGLRTMAIDGATFRVLVRTTASGTRFAVVQDLRLRRELARYGALRSVLPFLVLVPVLLLLVARLVHQLFGPVTRLAQEVNERGESDLHPIAEAGVPSEVQPFVSAINRLLERVGQSVRAQQRFVADAAHELRSPLAALSLQAERLAQVELPQAGRERLVALRCGIERARQLIDQLLALARAQAQAVPAPADASVSVQAVFRRVLEDLMPLAETRQIDIGVVGAEDAEVAAAEIDVFTIVRNLADNAIRYTPAGGRVDLAVRTTASAVEIRVSDSGPGIALAERERVFDPFYRAAGSDQVGSGLGLSIVRAIAMRLGARVALDAADAEHGTGLRVTVALAAPARRGVMGALGAG